MPWTESRSRDEWLAEVQRRGERIQRRRRLAGSLVGVIALLVPVYAVASFLTDDSGKQDLTVAASGDPTPTFSGRAPAVAETTPTQPEPTSPPTTELRASVTTIPGNARPADEPVVRPTTTTAGPRPSITTAAPDTVVSTTVPPRNNVLATVPAENSCPVEDVLVTVTTDKASYRKAENVRYSSTLENRSSTPCMVPGGAYFSVLDEAGTHLGPPAALTGDKSPVKLAPGQTITVSSTPSTEWTQQVCLVREVPCAQAEPGTYTVRAEWLPAYGSVFNGSTTIRIVA